MGNQMRCRSGDISKTVQDRDVILRITTRKLYGLSNNAIIDE